MFQVTLEIRDQNEAGWWLKNMADLEAYRNKIAHAEPEEAVHDAAYAEQAPADEAEPPAQVIAVISPEGVTKLPDEDKMVDALRGFLKKNNNDLAVAHAFLKKFGLTKVTDNMTPEVKLALYAALTK